MPVEIVVYLLKKHAHRILFVGKEIHDFAVSHQQWNTSHEYNNLVYRLKKKCFNYLTDRLVNLTGGRHTQVTAMAQ